MRKSRLVKHAGIFLQGKETAACSPRRLGVLLWELSCGNLSQCFTVLKPVKKIPYLVRLQKFLTQHQLKWCWSKFILVMPAGTPTGYWLFQSHFHFRKSSLQGLHLLIKLHPQVLDVLHHFHQPHVCVFLDTTQVFIPFSSVSVIEPFLWVFFKPLDSLRRSRLFKFCVLRFIYAFSLTNISIRFLRFGEKILVWFVILFVFLQWDLSM